MSIFEFVKINDEFEDLLSKKHEKRNTETENIIDKALNERLFRFYGCVHTFTYMMWTY